LYFLIGWRMDGIVYNAGGVLQTVGSLSTTI